MRKVKIAILYMAKILGLFAVARHLTRSQLNILCWHGFSNQDECAWEAGIMLHPEVLEQRLKSIVGKYTLLSLEEAVTAFENRCLPKNTLVVTLDDGFRGTLTLAHPLFTKYKIPYTLYLTTYYLNKDIQIINLVLKYALWKTQSATITCDFDNGQRTFNLKNHEESKELFDLMFSKIDTMKSEQDKKVALKSFLISLNLDAEEILSREWLKIVDLKQLKALHDAGVDIQLHTHKHRFVDNNEALCEDIIKNMSVIKEHTDKDAFHLCYPSGQYRLSALDCLKSLKIKSGTTCHVGLNSYGQDVLLLKRYLDSGNSHQIEFEANVSGFIPLVKKFLHKGE